MHEDLDARLVFVVAATVQVINAHDSRGVGQEVLFRQEITDFLGDHRRAALPATDINGKTDLALVVLFQVQTDIVNLNGGAVALGTRYRDLELARQEREFRMYGRPLTQDFRIGARIGDFVGGCPCEMIGSNVANAVA
ncbi:hypothetical protein D3C71_1246170 [compost metagenome]